MEKEEIAPEMRLYDPDGSRLYLTAPEQKAFLEAANEEDREARMYCQTLHYTGCRPSKALELALKRIFMQEPLFLDR